MAISKEQITMQLNKTQNNVEFNSASIQAVSRLAQKLQTTLLLNELLTIFSTELSANVNHTSFKFTQHDNNILIEDGHVSHHSCNYELSIENTPLGTLTFTRRKRFLDNELSFIENNISTLLYPLRNALLYHQAILSAHTDSLTGALNRSTLKSVYQKEVALTKRHSSNLTLMVLDIDFFKKVNDTYGHNAGDLALKSLTQCIKKTLRESDPLFRLGGEEFAILLNDTDLAGATLLAERLRKEIQSIIITHQQNTFSMSVSIGLTQFANADSLEDIMLRADSALYKAKKTGRNKVISL